MYTQRYDTPRVSPISMTTPVNEYENVKRTGKVNTDDRWDEYVDWSIVP